MFGDNQQWFETPSRIGKKNAATDQPSFLTDENKGEYSSRRITEKRVRWNILIAPMFFQ